MIRKYLAALVLSIVTTTGAHAGKLADKFEEATTAAGPGTYEVMGRTVHQGGYARLRFKTMGPLRPVKFTMPTFDGGCNGFDLYGGSFSYIGKDKFVEYLENVATNVGTVATYMFLTFLQDTCATCKEVIDGLYALQDALNQTLGGSCEMAEGLVGGMKKAFTEGHPDNADWDRMNQRYKGVVQEFGKSKAHFEDAFDLMWQAENNAASAANTAIPDAEEREARTTGGNALYWAVNDDDLFDAYRNDLHSSLSKQELHSFLTYLLGNSVATLQGDNFSAENVDSIADPIHFITGDFPDTVPRGNYSGTYGVNLADDPRSVTEFIPDLQDIFKDWDCAMTGVSNTGDCSGYIGLLNVINKPQEELGSFDIASSPEMDYLEKLKVGNGFSKTLVEYKGSTEVLYGYYNCVATKVKYEYLGTVLEPYFDSVITYITNDEDLNSEAKQDALKIFKASKAKFYGKLRNLIANEKSGSCDDLQALESIYKLSGRDK